MSHHSSTRMTEDFYLRMSPGPKPGQADVPRHDPKEDAQQHQQVPQQHPGQHGDHAKPGSKPHGPRKRCEAAKAHRVVDAFFVAQGL